MLVRLLVIAFTLLVSGSLAHAAKRVALVIGNSDYASVERLRNPQNDATVLARTLETMGFDKVTLKLNLNGAHTSRTLRQFSRDAAGADVALIYFAGHGIEVGGQNYLIPTDAKLEFVDDVEFEATSLTSMMASLNRANGFKLVILDACRNNPFRNTMQTAGASRSVGRGLARVSPRSSDTLVAYAAEEGTVAADGDGEHSPFAQALIKHIPVAATDVRIMFGRVRDDVKAATGGKQVPFTYGSLGGQQIFLHDKQLPATPSQPSADLAEQRAARAWATISETRSIAVLDTFLKSFPDGLYAGFARARRTELQKQAKLSAPDVSDTAEPDKPSANAKRGWLGVKIQDLTDQLAEAVGLPKGTGGALVNSVTQDGPADKHGLLSGDIVLAVDGHKLKNMRDLPPRIAALPPGASAKFEIRRKKQILNLTVRLGELSAKPRANAETQVSQPPRRAATGGTRGVSHQLRFAGLILNAMTPELRKKHNIAQSINGLVVSKVSAGSQAGEVGIKEGHVLVEVALEGVSEPQHAHRLLKAQKQVNRKSVLILTSSGKIRTDVFRALPLQGVELALVQIRSVSDLLSSAGRVEGTDVQQAVRLYKQAAQQNSHDALLALGRLHDQGRGVARDAEAAATYVFTAIQTDLANKLDQYLERIQQLSPATIKALQRKLRGRGHYSGAIDGKYGPGTERAIRALAKG